MELENHTRFPARLFRTAIDDDRIAASLVTKITYEVRGTELTPSESQPWLISAEPWKSEYGVMDTDQLFYRGGVDLFQVGKRLALGAVRPEIAAYPIRVEGIRHVEPVPHVLSAICVLHCERNGLDRER